MKKRILSIITSLTLCLSLLPTTVFAEDHSCADEDHDHWCDTCGDVVYQTTPLDSGHYACKECGAIMVNISGEYTKLNYHGLEEGTLVDGTAEISVAIPSYKTGTFEFVESGTVTVFWTDEEGSVFENHTVENAELADGKTVVSFANLPIEILHHGNLLYKPADAALYLPESNGMVLEYQDNVYRLAVDANVDCTINGVYEDSLYLFAGTEVSVIPLGDFWGELTWSYEDGSAAPEYEVLGSIVNFIMPEGDVEAILEYVCVSCVDEDGDHWCDFCNTLISLCADEDGDHFCDVCWEYLSELCIDGEDENIHACDICWASMPELCEDGDDDHACDLCGTIIENVCYDENEDHCCDNEACGNEISECEECDWDEDNVCDLCGKGIYPSAGELNIEAVAADGTITVTWDALEDAGDDKVASYTVSCCLEESFEPLQQSVYEPGSESYSHTFSGLDNNVVYDVSVDAEYTQVKDGFEEPFGAIAVTTVTALPGAPTILSVEYGNGSVTVEWEAPENKGFPDIRSYVITAEQNGIGIGIEVEATGEETMRCTLNDLLNGQTYQIYVSAVNGVGQGAAAITTAAIPLIPYSLEIGGVPVTEENMDDVLGDNTVSLNPVTTTLTLNNAHINVTEGNYGIRSKTALKLELIGENSIACSGVYGFHSTDDVTVVGSGSLNITANDVGIYIAGGYEIGGLYLEDGVTLNVTSGNVSSGNSYGVRVDDVLEVRDNATLIAAAGTAPERSCGIYAYDEVNVYDNAVVTATGADQSVELNTDCDGIRTTHISMYGGTLTATGGTAATTNGIFTQSFDMYGGTLTAVSGSTAGGTCFGPSAALQSTRRFYIADGTVFATSGPAGNDTSCGILVSNGELRVDGGSLFAESGEANFSYGIKASQLSLRDGYIEAAGAEGVWCSDGISVEGSLTVEGGDIVAKAADAGTYSYGLQAFEMDITNGGISASAGSAANSYGLWSFGAMNIAAENIRLNPYTPGFSGTRVTASAKDGYAVYSRSGVVIADALTITIPEGGSVAGCGEAENPDYYTVAATDGAVAQQVEIDVLTYKIVIDGLKPNYDMAVEVPAGLSVNEIYCEKYGVEDFSEIIPTDKDGYIFHGFYTVSGEVYEKYDFDTPVYEDMTITAKWTRITYDVSSGGASNTTTKTEKNEDGSTTTTTINNATGTVTETTKTEDGVTGTVVTDKDGEVTGISVMIPAAAAKEAQENGAAVTLPVKVELADNVEEAVEIDVDVPTGGAKVEISVKDVTPGTVVVIVNKDGTEEIVKTSTVTEIGVVVTLESDVTIKVIDNSRYFADVHPAGHWAESAIDFVSARGLLNGYGNGYFGSEDELSRGMLAQVLYNLEGRPAVSGEMPFTDVDEGRYYYDAIRWAAANGIVSGYGNGLFGPDDNITRQQLAAMLYGYEQYKGGGFTGMWMFVLDYTDRDQISEWAYEPMCWMTMHGVMNGYGSNVLGPRDSATRAQVAQMLKNYLENAN